MDPPVPVAANAPATKWYSARNTASSSLAAATALDKCVLAASKKCDGGRPSVASVAAATAALERMGAPPVGTRRLRAARRARATAAAATDARVAASARQRCTRAMRTLRSTSPSPPSGPGPKVSASRRSVAGRGACLKPKLPPFVPLLGPTASL